MTDLCSTSFFLSFFSFFLFFFQFLFAFHLHISIFLCCSPFFHTGFLLPNYVKRYLTCPKRGCDMRAEGRCSRCCFGFSSRILLLCCFMAGWFVLVLHGHCISGMCAAA